MVRKSGRAHGLNVLVDSVLMSFYNIVDATCVACIDNVGNWDSVWRQYHVFLFWENPTPHELFPCSKILSFFLMLSLLVILRSCIASLKVLNYDLEDRLKKVYDCVRFIQTIPMVWASIAHSRCPRSIILQTHQNAFLSSQIYFSTNSSISCLKCGCRIVNFIL